MWNAFTVKYHAKVAHMLLNRESLNAAERLWLFSFYIRLKAPWEILIGRLRGYGIGIGQIISPKVPGKEKKKLMQNWWKRITQK
jgi:hypothetical protein